MLISLTIFDITSRSLLITGLRKNNALCRVKHRHFALYHGNRVVHSHISRTTRWVFQRSGRVHQLTVSLLDIILREKNTIYDINLWSGHQAFVQLRTEISSRVIGWEVSRSCPGEGQRTYLQFWSIIGNICLTSRDNLALWLDSSSVCALRWWWITFGRAPITDRHTSSALYLK